MSRQYYSFLSYSSGSWLSFYIFFLSWFYCPSLLSLSRLPAPHLCRLLSLFYSAHVSQTLLAVSGLQLRFLLKHSPVSIHSSSIKSPISHYKQARVIKLQRKAVIIIYGHREERITAYSELSRPKAAWTSTGKVTPTLGKWLTGPIQNNYGALTSYTTFIDAWPYSHGSYNFATIMVFKGF